MLLVLLVLATALSACSPSRSSRDVNYFSGIGEVTFEFLKDSPPSETYEGSDFIVSFLVKNQGPIDLNETMAGKISISYDPFYLEPAIATQSPLSPLKIALLGRDYDYPPGESRIYDYVRLKAKSVEGQRQIPETQLFASLCYPYKTVLDVETCMDISKVYPSERPTSCTSSQQSFSGQGSPMAITSIEPEMLPTSDKKVRPQFKINIENKGQGTLLAPVNESVLDKACSVQPSMTRDWNTVFVSASLLGKKMECMPSQVRLSNGIGFTRCTFSNEADYVATRSNYLTQLHVELSYVYSQSISKEITIIRNYDSEYYSVPSPVGVACSKYEVKNSSGVCEPKCGYCKTNPGSPDCALDRTNTRFENSFTLNQNFSCACSRQECLDKEPKGTCVFEFCPGALYCCES